MVPGHSQTLPLWFCWHSGKLFAFAKTTFLGSSKVITILLQLYSIRLLHRCWPVYTASLGPGWSHTRTFNHLHTQHWTESIFSPRTSAAGISEARTFFQEYVLFGGMMTKCCVFLLEPSGLNPLWFHECHSWRITLSPFRGGLWSSPIPQCKTAITQILRAS